MRRGVLRSCILRSCCARDFLSDFFDSIALSGNVVGLRFALTPKAVFHCVVVLGCLIARLSDTAQCWAVLMRVAPRKYSIETWFMQRIHIIGRKNSGKTTLVADLVAHFVSLGRRVGTIKHTHHQHELDTPGKDSHTHREAGSAVVGILTPNMTAIFRPATGDRHDTDERYQWLAPMYSECEFVIVEGNSQTTAPKFEVWRAATGTEPIASTDRTILAVITDDPLPFDYPTVARSSIEQIAARIVER